MKTLEFACSKILNDGDVNSLLTAPPLVILSIYGESKKQPDIFCDLPVITGKVKFLIDYFRVSNSAVYSPIYENPTWKDVLNACNDLLQNGDHCGVFLEELLEFTEIDSLKYPNIINENEIKDLRNGVRLIEFSLGS
jgi:hypothetical protein